MATAPLYLTVLRHEHTIAVDLTEVAPVVPRGWLQIEERLLTEIGEELARITALANKRAALGVSGVAARIAPVEGAHRDIQPLGALIFSHLFPAAVQQRLASLPPADLFLRVDDQLVHVPWELAFDGRDFLCMKFRIGRQVISHQRPRSDYVPLPQPAAPLKMLIITDPTETLPAVAEECEQLCSFLSACAQLDVTVMGGTHLRKLDLLQALNEHALVHYAGHAYFDAAQPGDSGWVLHNAVLTAAEIGRLARPPALVFANACEAGATTRWQSGAVYDGQAFGIGSAFLLAGTPNYIGTFCVIHDTHSAAFAADFYHHLLQGEPIGVALAAARRRAFETAQRSGLLWASYVHYGNPAFHLPRAPVDTGAASEGISSTVDMHVLAPPERSDAGVTPQRAMVGDIPHGALPSPAPETPPYERFDAQAAAQATTHAHDETPAVPVPGDGSWAVAGMARKLAAILSTDVKEYSRLMGEDEVATIRTLTVYREVMASLIHQHRGRIVDAPGDNLLAEFASVVEAVQCAVAIQRELTTRNAQLLPHRRMEFRIGVNLGDIIIEGERIYGDGVNIAARLEGLAEAGGLCISGTVYDQVKTKLALTYEALGVQHIKNIAEPVRVYRVRLEPGPADPQAPARDERRFLRGHTRLVLLGAGVLIVTLALVTALWTAHSRSRLESAGPLTAQDEDSLAHAHLLANQGHLDAALIAYRHTTEKPHSTPWQQAMAYNRLGQIYAAQGQVVKALECYEKAVSQRQDMALAHANKAYLLAQLGRRQEALGAYRQALQLNPDDVLTTTLFREAQRREQLALDKDKQERLDRLVAELLQTQKAGRPPGSPRDAWTSPPLTLAFMDMQSQGTLSPRAGEPEFFWLRLTQAMRGHARLQLIEREVMDKLLAELKLSAAALTESQTAVQVGKLLAARLIAISTFRRAGATGQIGVRLIETETGRIQAMVTETFEASETLDTAAAQLARTLLTQVRQQYPLQGRIARLTPEVITLDIGAAQGVTPGVTLHVFGREEPIERHGTVVDYHRIPVGLVEVTSVAAQFAQARVLEQTAALQPGWKVQEVQEQ